jgi:hypothetical protein
MLFSSPAALADTQPNAQVSGATTQQVTAGNPTTPSSQAQDPGTPGNTQVSQGTPDQTQSGANAAPSGTGSSGSSTSAADSSGGTSSDSSANATAPPATTGGNASGAPASGSSAPSNTLAAAGSTPDTATQTASSGATANQGSPSNGAVTVRVGQGGNDGAVGQTNSASTTSASDATNGVAPAGSAPPSGGTPPSNASASTTQTTPSNSNIVVRVGSPGDAGGASQANDSQAAAAATGSNAPAGSTISSGAPSATISSSAQANAAATQISPDNISVVVRVASPGNNGPVKQQNTVGANAGTSLPNQATSSNTSVSPVGTDQLVSTSGSSLAGNVNQAGQSIDQANNVQAPPLDPSASSQTATPSPGITIGSANAKQIDSTNMNVSVRIASPGSDGVVSQVGSATATGTSPDLSVVNVTGGSNTNVSIVLPGSASGAPSSGPWVWNWNWSGDWKASAGATADGTAPTAAAVWNWVWTNDAGAASQPSNASTPAGTTQDGTWTWSWTWKLADGQTLSWGWSKSCTCNWNWNWNWDWSSTLPTSTPGAVATGTPTAPASEGVTIGPVTQSNVVSADASASTEISSGPLLTQIVASDPTSRPADGLGSGLVANQTLLSQQLASALAEADQTGSWNRNVVWGVATAPVSQSNTISAVAIAAVGLDVTQNVSQTLNVNDASNQIAIADQSIQNTQSALAVARTIQTGAGNANVSWAPDPNQASIGSVDQMNSASTMAAVADYATGIQALGQLEDIGSATVQFESVTQQLVNEQLAGAEALASQLQTWNENLLLVPLGSRATNPSLRQRNDVWTSSLSGNFSAVSQSARQGAGGIADVQISNAVQQAGIAQSASAFSPAEQTNLLNLAEWLGIEPPTPPGVSSSGGASISSGTVTIIGVQTTVISSGTVTSIRSSTIALVVDGSALQLPRLPKSSAFAGLGTPPPATCGSACSGFSAASGAVAPLSPALGQNARQKSSAQRPQQQAPPCTCVASPGPASSAPSGSSGPVGVDSAPYTFAAPALQRPQFPASVLGRPTAFLDPFERPG